VYAELLQSEFIVIVGVPLEGSRGEPVLVSCTDKSGRSEEIMEVEMR